MKARRGNGDGAIDKVKRARKDGTIVERWRGRISVGTDPRTNKPRRITLYASTRSELATKIARLQSDASRGIIPSSERMTVAQFMKRWLDDVAAARVRETTMELYRGLSKNHIEPIIGARRLDALTPQDVQNVLASMQRAGKSERTRTLALIVLRSALDQALRWELVPRNVAQAVDRPRTVRHEMLVLDRKQVQRFLAIAEGTRFHALYILAVTTGMRRGELLGLQWSDVNIEKRTLSVSRSIVTLKGAPVVAEPKTAAGRRQIDLPGIAVRALRTQQADLFAQGLRASPWIFPNENGGPMSPRNLIRRSFIPLLDRIILDDAEFPRIRFHDLRHTAATLMLALGVQPKVVQERLGHASIAVTMDTYSHVMPSMQREAADNIEALFMRLNESGG